jgi:ERCC4-type nuclease
LIEIQTSVHYAGGKDMSKAPLIIDSNERGPLHDAVIRAAERQGFPIKKEHLQGMGDYKAGNAHIECKSLSDLFQSSHSGHLMRQIENLDANCERVFFVVHGDIAKYVALSKKQGRNVSYSKVMNELLGTFARIMADFDCHIYRAKDHSEAAMFIAKLHSKMHKPASRHGARAVTRVSTNDVRADMLITIPGFGPDLVDKLLAKCGSIEEMLFPESLKQVKGMGTTLRQRLLEVLTSEEPVRVQKTYNKRGK